MKIVYFIIHKVILIILYIESFIRRYITDSNRHFILKQWNLA